MSRTTHLSGGIVAIHNGDYSGKVVLRFHGSCYDHAKRFHVTPLGDRGEEITSFVEVEVTMADLRKLVFGHIRSEAISRIEAMDDHVMLRNIIRGGIPS